MAEADAYIRIVSAPFGPLTDAQWDHLTRTSVAQNADGRCALTYDPGIAVPFRERGRAAGPVAALGRDPLPDARAARRAVRPACPRPPHRRWPRGVPRPRLVEFPGVGHAPMLLSSDQFAPVVAFLREGPDV